MFVKVRETYDLHTTRDKMSIIGIHTPNADIIKKNYPGLLMQCKAYRPASCDVKLACASMLPVDPLGVGLAEGDIAPEDMFNPILYKAMSNFGMSNLEKYIESTVGNDWHPGSSVDAEINGILPDDNPGGYDDFSLYYGLLAQTHEWKHANPQSGLAMASLRPLVYDVVATVGDNAPDNNGYSSQLSVLDPGDDYVSASSGIVNRQFLGKPKEMPMLNCTTISPSQLSDVPTGFSNTEGGSNVSRNKQLGVPAPKIFVGCIIVPPSRLHQLFYRMVVEWTLEFSMIRSITDITTWRSLCALGDSTHFMSYNFESKDLKNTTGMVDASEDVEINKVM